MFELFTNFFASPFLSIRDFLEQGGVVLSALFVLSFLLFFFAISYFAYLRSIEQKRSARLFFLRYAIFLGGFAPLSVRLLPNLPPATIFAASHRRKIGGARYPLEDDENITQNNKWDDYYRQLYFSAPAKQMMKAIKTCCALAPLLGLLGTLIGMIEIFDVIAISGNGNLRALASGIAAATLPTMAGMVVAVSGLLFVILLERKTNLILAKTKGGNVA